MTHTPDTIDTLIATARQIITDRYIPAQHIVGAAVRGVSGALYTGVALDCYVRRAAICAEAIAIGAAMTAGETGITHIVALRHPAAGEVMHEPFLVAPCGLCRELISDYGKDCVIIIPDTNGAPQPTTIHTLLPNRYAKRK